MSDVWLTLGLFVAEMLLAVRLLHIAYVSYKDDIAKHRAAGIVGRVIPTGNQLLLGIVGLLVLGGASIVTYDILTISTATYTIASSGIIPQEIGNVDIEIYSDVFGTEVVTSIEWGTIEITSGGPTILRTVYVRNIGGDSFTANITTRNWLFDQVPPVPSQYGWFTLTWDFGDSQIGVGRQRKVVLSLWASDSIVGITDFSFDIVITATEA